MSFIKVTKQNAWSLWKAGAIAATNVPITANFIKTTALTQQPAQDFVKAANNMYANGTPFESQVYYPILANIALKRGFNAIRVFLDLQVYDDAVGTHDISNIAALGWSDASVRRNLAKNWLIPYYALLAEQITNLLATCESLGLGVIICPGDAFSGRNGALWQTPASPDKDYQAHLISFWSKTAQKWASSNALIGYELINEPDPGVGMTYAAMRAAGNRNDFKALMDSCVTAIRAYDSTTPILVSTPQGSSVYGFDYFGTAAYSDAAQLQVTNFDGTNKTKLISGNYIVYTFHYYAPSRYTHQGIYDWSYFGIGLTYPFNSFAEDSQRDGQSRMYRYPIANRDLRDSVKMASAFKAAFPDCPIFLGEFSAASTAHLQTLDSTGTAFGVQENNPTRQIVSMYQYLKAGVPTARVVLKTQISLFEFNDFDAQGLPLATNNVTLTIKSSAANSAPYVGTRQVKLIGNRYKVAGDPASQTVNFYFEFPLSGTALPTVGLSRSDVEQALVNGTEGTLFNNAASVGSFKIEFPQAMVNQQEASRAEYAMDVLRMCSDLGFSWAWFCEYNYAPAWTDKYWSINDTAVGAVGDAGKRIRALLKRAASQSVE